MRSHLLKTMLVATAFSLLGIRGESSNRTSPRKIYMTFILHGNMNYDRYVKSTIWRDFPVIYDRLLDFMDEHPDFKGQIQLSGQTFNTLRQTAPHVIEHALQLQKKGQLNFTGTFYSEPVNVNMDGETNFRCAKLGTSIISDAVGSTDGFYLQERAYHAQLPWILNHSEVSWIPVITGDDTFVPFRLKGMDGSVSVCIPNVSRHVIVDKIKIAPANSLLLIEGDYEIPQSFTGPYEKICAFDKENDDIEIEWILAKDYIGRFGVGEERYVDHSAKAKDLSNGTYSRWTADPLDIIVQDYTNKAMADFRAASVISSLTHSQYGTNVDLPFSESKITLKHDHVPWNIEQAGLYTDVEPAYLERNGKVTILSRAEHLLLWAVNSDAKGWYPLFERRRERINSFENSSDLSREIIHRGLDVMARNIRVEGYDRYFIVFNAEPSRVKELSLEFDRPFALYDASGGELLKNSVTSEGGKYAHTFEIAMPAYGYKVIGLKKSETAEEYPWKEGTFIENGGMKLSSEDDRIILKGKGPRLEMSLDSFKIRALAEMSNGTGDDEWRDTKPYGSARISVRNFLYPQLRVEKQIDWLIHLQQTFTLLSDRVLCEMEFVFAHPTLVRKTGRPSGADFDPRGLTLLMNTGTPGKVYYDIPFGISPHSTSGVSYFCPLSTAIFQSDRNDGFMITAGTGEQAFYTHPEKGMLGLYMGASTTSGPIRDVIMKNINTTNVDHELAWYLEPFHGTYTHRLMIFPFGGTWQENHAPAVSKNYTRDLYLREFYPVFGKRDQPAEKSLITIHRQGIELTTAEYNGNRLMLRLNDKEGQASDIRLTVGRNTRETFLPANGIIEVTF